MNNNIITRLFNFPIQINNKINQSTHTSLLNGKTVHNSLLTRAAHPSPAKSNAHPLNNIKNIEIFLNGPSGDCHDRRYSQPNASTS